MGYAPLNSVPLSRRYGRERGILHRAPSVTDEGSRGTGHGRDTDVGTLVPGPLGRKSSYEIAVLRCWGQCVMGEDKGTSD